MTNTWRRLIGLSVAGLLVLGVAGCGDDDDDGGNGGGDNDELIDQMVAEGATREEAECVVDELGDDAERLLTMDEDEDPDPEDLVKFLEAISECGIGE